MHSTRTLKRTLLSGVQSTQCYENQAQITCILFFLNLFLSDFFFYLFSVSCLQCYSCVREDMPDALQHCALYPPLEWVIFNAIVNCSSGQNNCLISKIIEINTVSSSHENVLPILSAHTPAVLDPTKTERIIVHLTVGKISVTMEQGLHQRVYLRLRLDIRLRLHKRLHLRLKLQLRLQGKHRLGSRPGTCFGPFLFVSWFVKLSYVYLLSLYQHH